MLYPVRSQTRENVMAEINFVTDDANDPSTITDPGGIALSIAGPAVTCSAGTYVVTLKQRWAVVMAVAEIDDVSDEFLCNVSATTNTTITIRTKVVDFAGSAISLVDTAARGVTVLIHMQR